MREKILMVAATQMNKRGIKFTVDHVAVGAGISKKTIYRHFASKNVLITQVIEMALVDIEKQEREILANQSRSFAEKITDLMLLEPKEFGKTEDWVLEDIKRHCNKDWERIEQFKYERMLVLKELLDEGISLGIVEKVNTQVAARVLLGAARELSQYEFLRENNLDSIQARQLLVEIFLHGILTEKTDCK